MEGRNIDLNARIKNDLQVIREGADINVLHDDFVPLSNILSSCLKVISTFASFLIISLIAAYLAVEPESIGIAPTDSSLDMLLKIAAKFAQVEFTWGLAAGILGTSAVITAALKLYRVRRRHGWTTISSPYELEALLAIRPVFGTPEFFDREELDDSKSAFSESMMSLEALLEQKFDGDIPKTIAVMSSMPAEGKTTLSIGLSQALSRSGQRVLLIDGDLRNPSLSQTLHANLDKGLSTMLAGSDLLFEEAIHPVEKNIDLLPSGPLPPNPPHLLRPERLRALLDTLGKQYDHIIIDMTPVLGIADATRWSPLADVILYALEANRTWVYHAIGAIRRLGSGINIIPVVTKIPIAQFGYTYGYGYSYAYEPQDGDEHS